MNERKRWSGWLRRCFQVGVVFFMAYTAMSSIWRNYKVAHNQARLVTLMKGDFWGTLYQLNEDFLSLIGKPFEASLSFLGFPWSARVLGVEVADPIMAAAHVVSTGELATGLILAVAVSLGLTLIFGKFFCSHLCPMRLLFELGQLVRRGLESFNIKLPMFRSDVRLGGWVLIGGLVATALSGTAVWLIILPYANIGASIFLLATAATTSGLIFVSATWLLIDTLVAPGFFCHNLCPTAFVLEQIARFSFWRVRATSGIDCPGTCSACTSVCPYHLSVRGAAKNPACDNCGACVSVCPTKRIERSMRLPIISTLLLAFIPCWSQPAFAHHNKGLPHYGYFENYPQVPTEEYIIIDDHWELGATVFNFQGMQRENSDTPNDVKIYLYLYDLDAEKNYVGPAEFEIRLDGQTVSRFSRSSVDEETVYSSRETLPESGEYEIVVVFKDRRLTLPFYVDISTGEFNPWILLGIAFPVLLVIGLALRGTKRKRRRRRTGSVARASQITRLMLLGGVLMLPYGAARADGDSGARAVVVEHAEHGETCQYCGMTNCPMDHSAAITDKANHAGDGVTCQYCGMVNCTMAHFETNDGGSVMVMGGIPLWLFLFGIGGVIVFSFLATEWFAFKDDYGFKIDLSKNKTVYRILKNRWVQVVPQLITMGALVFLIYAGLFGSRVANITPIAVWTIWWAALIFGVLFFGSLWCFVCPWDGVANLVSRLSFSKKTEGISLGFEFPESLKNMYPAIALFTLLTWLELGYGVTTNPRSTAYMALAMTAAAVMAALVWKGKRFCAHFCPVGRICGMYSNFSPVEIRSRKPATCAACKTEDCLNGNRDGYPCPTGLSLKTVDNATMCIACTECFKSCDKNNVAINVRPFAQDLENITSPKLDEAWMAIMLLALTLFHGLSMTPTWESFEPGSMSILKWMAVTFGTPKIVNFSVGMAVVVATPVGLYWLCCALSARWAAGGVTTKTLFVHYAYSLLPVALFYHLAHNLMHLLMEGGEIIPRLSDPMGSGANWLGTRDVHIGSLISESNLWYAQVTLILIGHVYGIVVAHRIGHKLYPDRRKATRSLATMPVMMILISVTGLWLMHMDMNMRMGRM